MRGLGVLTALAFSTATPAMAIDDSGHYQLRLVCVSPDEDVRMEVYLPHDAAFGRADLTNAKKPVLGYYALDLDKIGKGKSLEPVKVWKDEKYKILVVDQFTRGHPRTRVPLAGGVVNFDNRFAVGARCKPFGETRADDDAVPFPPAPPESGTDAN